MERWTWKWIGGGTEAVTAPTREAAYRAAVELGLKLATRGLPLTPDLPTLNATPKG